MEPQTYTAHYQCECGDGNCARHINDADYEWFSQRYNTDTHVIYASLCPHLPETDAVRIRGRAVAIGTRRLDVDYVCECGKDCGFKFEPGVYRTLRRMYPDTELHSIRHSNCQTSINFERVVTEGPGYMVYSNNPTLKEINLKTLREPTDISEILAAITWKP